MEAGAAGRVARGACVRTGVQAKGRGSRRHTACLRLHGDVMTVWQFGEKQGLGKDGRVEGLNKKKPMLTNGMEGGMELIDPLSAFCSEDHWQTEAPVFITCNVNVTMRTLHLGYGNVHQTLQFSMFAWCRQSGWKEATSKRFTEMHSNLLNDWKIIMYSQLIISKIAADWEHNQDGRFVFTGFLTCCWGNKSHFVSRIVVLWESRIFFVGRDSVLLSRIKCICPRISLYLFTLDISICFRLDI